MEETKTQKTDVLFSSDFVHLHNHTHHSLLDGLTKVPSLIEKIKDLGMSAVAITDHGTMSGVIEFYKTARSSKIKPIIGMEAYVAARSHNDRDPQKDKARYHLIILAMNNQGYQNLMKLSTIANLEGFYYKPRIDHELLQKYNEGLIILSGCASSELGESLRIGNIAEAKKIAKWYKSVFGERYYLELQDHGHPKSPSAWDVQVGINKHLVEISNEFDIPCVVTSDGHYLAHDDQDAHEVLLCVGTGAFLSDLNRMSLKDFELHVTDPKEIIKRWGDTNPEAIKNTKKIADMCSVDIELGRILIPKFPTPEGQTEKEFLHKLTYRGMAVRYLLVDESMADAMSIDEIRKKLSPEQRDRLDMELGVMDKMGYNGYFLIVQDFINWGKQRGIIFGPGRGSAAGSIVAFALNITDLDPLKYDLLFERFLNPDRISMPDIDIDIQDTRRDEVIKYCADKYGSTRVANIVTFGTMAARASVRDVARVLQVPYAEADRLSKMIPPPVQGRHIPLSASIKDNVELREEYNNNSTAKEIFDYAMRLEGTIRSHGVHAAGVVIAPDDIVNYSPLEMAQKGVVSTQYSMGPVEELGLLKMDFLGLSNLTIINNTLRIIRKVYGNDIELSKLPLDDNKTYHLFQKGDTTGVFQLESAGMKRYLRELKPTVFDDIIAMVALYRPGPMQFIESFIKRKHGKEKIEYLHEGMKSSLENTYGILVYQEQFMQISKEWCGFTGGQADTLRKAVGKKKIDLMRKVKSDFVNGAMTHGRATKEIAEKFWDQLEEFANYCFNKSHAACYALIAYWTAYLKAHYPEAFMAALMTSDKDDIERLAIEIAEAQHIGIQVLAPDVNQSFVEFAVVPGKKQIRFGLAAIKGVGVSAVEEILRAREDSQFINIEDFARRVSVNKFNKKAWESLIKSGGFDSFGNRSDLLYNLESIQSFASKIQKEAASGQTDIFGALGEVSGGVQPSVEISPAPEKHTERERLLWERELMGLYISAHPLDGYATYFAEQTIPLGLLTTENDRAKIIVGGIISSIRTIVTRNGSKMAFVGLEDKSGEAEVVVFPKIYSNLADSLKQDSIIRVEGVVNARDKDGNILSEIKVIADTIMPVTDKELKEYQPTGGLPLRAGASKMTPKYKMKINEISGDDKQISIATPVDESGRKGALTAIKKLFVHIKDPDDHEILLALKRVCRLHPGTETIVLVLGTEKKSAIKLPFNVDISDELVGKIVKMLDEDSVVVK